MVAYCAVCGAENRDTARFCQACGAALSGPGAQTSAPPLRSPTGMLPSNMVLKGRYIILARVGQGGMGAVYKASDTRDGRVVAVKELSESNALTPREREEARAGFRREAEMLAKLNHRNLPRVYDFFADSGKQYLVMDFVDGETLEDKLKRSPGGLPVDLLMKAADQLCDVLDYLHTQRRPVVFRDLKPGNIMMDVRGDVKLIDFGIARHFAAGKSSDTTALGTEGYAPPEQYGKGQRQTDARSDIYALGATLHHLLTGLDPAENPFKFVAPRSVRPGVPPEVDLAIMRAVEQDPASRWQSARLMKQALHGLKEKPKQPTATGHTVPSPVTVRQPVPVASTPLLRPPATPRPGVNRPAPAAARPRPAAPEASNHAPMKFWGAVVLGVLIGVGVVFGRELSGWLPRPDDFLESSLWTAIFWFTGSVAYAIAKRPVAACAAWLVQPIWEYSSIGWTQLALPIMLGVVLGWLMAIGGNRVTYARLVGATVLTMAAQQIVLMSLYGMPFRWEEVAGAVIGASAAYVVGWAFRR